jgi:hypothetical protein
MSKPAKKPSYLDQVYLPVLPGSEQSPENLSSFSLRMLVLPLDKAPGDLSNTIYKSLSLANIDLTIMGEPEGELLFFLANSPRKISPQMRLTVIFASSIPKSLHLCIVIQGIRVV